MGLMLLDFEVILRLFFHLERFLSKQAELLTMTQHLKLFLTISNISVIFFLVDKTSCYTIVYGLDGSVSEKSL